MNPVRGTEFVLQLPTQVHAASVEVPHLQVAIASVVPVVAVHPIKNAEAKVVGDGQNVL